MSCRKTHRKTDSNHVTAGIMGTSNLLLFFLLVDACKSHFVALLLLSLRSVYDVKYIDNYMHCVIYVFFFFWHLFILLINDSLPDGCTLSTVRSWSLFLFALMLPSCLCVYCCLIVNVLSLSFAKRHSDVWNFNRVPLVSSCLLQSCCYVRVCASIMLWWLRLGTRNSWLDMDPPRSAQSTLTHYYSLCPFLFCSVITLAASSGKRTVTVWRPSVRPSVLSFF